MSMFFSLHLCFLLLCACIVPVASHFYAIYLLFVFFLFSTHLQMHATTNERIRKQEVKMKKNGKTRYIILFVKSNQYSVVTRKPKLTIHVSFYNSYYVCRPCKINGMKNTLAHTQQNVCPPLFFSRFAFIARNTRELREIAHLCSCKLESISLASSVIRHRLSHSLQMNDINDFLFSAVSIVFSLPTHILPLLGLPSLLSAPLLTSIVCRRHGFVFV